LKPFNHLPVLPPSVDLLDRPILLALVEARHVLAELKGLSQALPNPLILVQSLTLQEARQSSEIENILTTHDELYRALAVPDGKSISPETKEVLRYREAMMQGLEGLRGLPLSTRLIQELQAILLGTDAGIRKTTGTVIKNARTGEVIYTPPDGESRIRDLLANLEVFLHDHSAIDPLVRMAVAHYQFEAIHPFYDGNGRTGRLINILYLIEQGLLTQPVLYLSAYFLKTRTRYYELLRLVTERQAWTEWVLYVLEGVRQTAMASIAKINEMRGAMQKIEDHIRTEAPSPYRTELTLLLFRSPVTTVQKTADELGIDYQTARKYLKRLTDAGLVRESRSGYTKLYSNERMLDLLRLPLLP
jgi:Fic family protein